jgi:hypothetical protein
VAANGAMQRTRYGSSLSVMNNLLAKIRGWFKTDKK